MNVSRPDHRATGSGRRNLMVAGAIALLVIALAIMLLVGVGRLR